MQSLIHGRAAIGAALLMTARLAAQDTTAVPRDSTHQKHDHMRMPHDMHVPHDSTHQVHMPMSEDMPGMKRDSAAMASMQGAMSPGQAMTMKPGPLGIPMNRTGSGTSWLPDASAMHAQGLTVRGWELMVHGVAFVTYDRQVGGPRGSDQFGSQNWGMLMASHPLGSGRLEVRGMLSADPWTVSERGYPLLLQSGESYNGVPLHDRQHPHDLFMELAADYQAPLTKQLGVEVYAAPVGEPALGPVAFPHRPSASGDPFAPLSHHWQDATHIAFGVVTAGLFARTVKLEGSIFNGREPDQHRADFDFTQHSPTLDSYSGRLTVNPAAAWSLSGWYGYLRSPEELTPDISIRRFGVAVLNERRFSRAGQWSSALIWGANLETGREPSGAPADHRISNSAVLETNLNLDGSNTVFGRIEYVNKSAGDLDVTPPPPPASDRFDIGSFSAGYIREIGPFTKYGTAGIGAVVILNVIPSSLRPYYNTRTPYGFGLFLRIRPSHSHMDGMQQQPSGMHDHTQMGNATTGRPRPDV